MFLQHFIGRPARHLDDILWSMKKGEPQKYVQSGRSRDSVHHVRQSGCNSTLIEAVNPSVSAFGLRSMCTTLGPGISKMLQCLDGIALNALVRTYIGSKLPIEGTLDSNRSCVTLQRMLTPHTTDFP